MESRISSLPLRTLWFYRWLLISNQTDNMNANERWKYCIAISTNQLYPLEKTLDWEKTSPLVCLVRCLSLWWVERSNHYKDLTGIKSYDTDTIRRKAVWGANFFLTADITTTDQTGLKYESMWLGMGTNHKIVVCVCLWFMAKPQSELGGQRQRE